MKTKLFLAAIFSLAIGSAVQAASSTKPAAPVTVTFVAPENFTDVKDGPFDSERSRAQVLDALKAHIEDLSRSYVTNGRHLEVKVTDVDLAGEFEPWRGVDFDHIRILKEIYPPRMELEFRLLDADGKVISEGKRHLQELGYLMTTVMPTTDPLRFDKDMLRSWMRQEFKRAS